jgi:hypothetical protein
MGRVRNDVVTILDLFGLIQSLIRFRLSFHGHS